MFPELFEIPFIHITVKSYGLMVVVGFLAAVFLVRRLSRRITPDTQVITNVALYSLLCGVAGSRLFYVVHYFEGFREDPLSVFAVWDGGLELLGGVIPAIFVIIAYLLYRRLPVRRYLDILAVGLMLGLAFGRIGCFLVGDCFGRPTGLPWGVRFPYDSLPFRSQVNPDLERNRTEPYLNLPDEYFTSAYARQNGIRYPKPYEDLTELQKTEVTKGEYRTLPVHPTQLYSSANAILLCPVLLLFLWRARRAEVSNIFSGPFTRPGCTFALAFILYGITRFLIEFLRGDNPFEYDTWIMGVLYNIYKGGTIAQNLCIYLVILGVALMAIFSWFAGTFWPLSATLNMDSRE